MYNKFSELFSPKNLARIVATTRAVKSIENVK